MVLVEHVLLFLLPFGPPSGHAECVYSTCNDGMKNLTENPVTISMPCRFAVMGLEWSSNLAGVGWGGFDFELLELQ
jgi:hypothetical protein